METTRFRTAINWARKSRTLASNQQKQDQHEKQTQATTDLPSPPVIHPTNRRIHTPSHAHTYKDAITATTTLTSPQTQSHQRPKEKKRKEQIDHERQIWGRIGGDGGRYLVVGHVRSP